MAEGGAEGRVGPLLAGTTLCLFLSSAGIVQRFGGVDGILAYGLFVLVGVGLAWSAAPALLRRLTARGALWGTAALLVALAVWLAVAYPLANSGRFGAGSDRDEALVGATTHLLRGEYPYREPTYLGNPISPLPGALLLATQWVLLGHVQVQTLVWLVLFVIVVRAYILDAPHTLALLLTLVILAPAFLYELATGSDFLANGLYILTLALLLLGLAREVRHHDGPLALLLGVALASRVHFLLWLPLLLRSLAARAGWRAAGRMGVLALLACAAVTLPFWWYEPASFSPLHTLRETDLFEQLLPGSRWPVLLATVAALLWALGRKSHTLPDFLRYATFVQALPLFATVFLPLFSYRKLYLYGSSGFAPSFLCSAVLLFWYRRQRRSTSHDGTA